MPTSNWWPTCSQKSTIACWRCAKGNLGRAGRSQTKFHVKTQNYWKLVSCSLLLTLVFGDFLETVAVHFDDIWSLLIDDLLSHEIKILNKIEQKRSMDNMIEEQVQEQKYEVVDEFTTSQPDIPPKTFEEYKKSLKKKKKSKSKSKSRSKTRAWK